MSSTFAVEPHCPGTCHTGDFRDFDHYCDVAGVQPGEEPYAFAAWLNALTGWDGQMSRCTTRTVRIPACDEHNGMHSVLVTLMWLCPHCGGPRGEPFSTISYDGSRRLGCDGWVNQCGHVDTYAAVRREAGVNQ